MKRLSIICFVTVLTCTCYLFSQVGNNTTAPQNDGSIPLPTQTSALPSLKPAGELSESREISDFIRNNGQWSFAIDKSTGSIHRAFGKAIKIKGYSKITKDNVEKAAMKFLTDNAKLLKLEPKNLKLVRKTYNNRRWYVSYTQVYQGLDVLLSEIELRIFENGNVMSFGADYYNNIDVPLTPAINTAEAGKAAVKGIAENKETDNIQSAGKLYILLVKYDGRVNYRLVYQVRFDAGFDGKYIAFVDAHKGEVVWRFNQVNKALTDITVSGFVRNKTYLDPVAELPMPWCYLTINNEQYTADGDGKIKADIGSGNVSVSGKIEGKWAYVVRKDNLNASIDTNVTVASPLKITWNDNNSINFERNLYYYATFMHDHISKLDTGFHSMDIRMKVILRVDSNGSPNAASYGDSIIFICLKNPNYHFAETPAILYHEYGHSINKALYNYLGRDMGMVNASANEGTADLTAAFILDDPIVGRGSITGLSQTSVRIVKNKCIFPDSVNNESHNDGLILSGAYWDLREAIGLKTTELLLHHTKYGTPDDPNLATCYLEWFLETLTADDDDGDLSNGTPHIAQIVNAFDAHGIGLGLYMGTNFSHKPYDDTQDTINPYKIYFQLKAIGVKDYEPKNIKVRYSTDNFKTVQDADAFFNSESGEYIANIPAQKPGTIVKYYMSATIPANERNYDFGSGSPDHYKPYCFLVGFNRIVYDSCESMTGWKAGISGDNATTGKWENNVPNLIDMSIYGGPLLQPGTDCSENGTKCFVTGAKGDLYNYNSYIPNGKTTLTSPEYDISGQKNPVLRFYKWFVNYNPYGYPASTPAQLSVYVSTDGGINWTIAEQNLNSTNGWEKSLVVLNDLSLNQADKIKLKFVVDVAKYQGMVISINEGLIDDIEIFTSPYGSTSAENGSIASGIDGLLVYPNPVNSGTSFKYYLTEQSRVSLKLYDALGNLVATLKDGTDEQGNQSYFWDGRDLNGVSVTSGIYYCRFQINGRSSVEKVVVNR